MKRRKPSRDWRTAIADRRGRLQGVEASEQIASSPPVARRTRNSSSRRASPTRSASTAASTSSRALASADGLLIAADRNPNTTGAKLLGLASRARRDACRASSTACAAARSRPCITLGEDLAQGRPRRRRSREARCHHRPRHPAEHHDRTPHVRPARPARGPRSAAR